MKAFEETQIEVKQAVAVLEGRRTTLESRVAAMVIESETDAQEATNLWAALDEQIKQGEAAFEKIDGPLKEARKALSALFKPPLRALKDDRAIISKAIGDYRRRVQEAADKANEAREREQAQHAERIASRTGQDVETVKERLPAPPPIEGPGRGFHTPQGAVTASKVQKWEVVDEKAIPWDHEGVCLWQLNTSAITELRRKAKDELNQAPPGIRFYYEETQKRRRVE